MRIVALDTHVTDFDGLGFDAFQAHGEFISYPRTTSAEIVERSRGAEALIVNKVVLARDVVKQLPELRYIGITATGTNNVDLHACQERSIRVTNVVNYSTHAVAQHAFAMILSHYSKLAESFADVASGAWQRSIDFSMPRVGISELAGRTLGIIGFGSIGKKMAEIATAFGMRVLIAAIPGREYRESRPSIEDLFSESDIVSLHCAFSPATEKLVNAPRLARMKPEAILINVSRGGLVDERALSEALATGRIAAAYLDVLSSEPPSSDNPLLSSPRAFITPHIAWAARESRERLIDEAVKNLEAYLRGVPRNVVA